MSVRRRLARLEAHRPDRCRNVGTGPDLCPECQHAADTAPAAWLDMFPADDHGTSGPAFTSWRTPPHLHTPDHDPHDDGDRHRDAVCAVAGVRLDPRSDLITDEGLRRLIEGT